MTTTITTPAPTVQNGMNRDQAAHLAMGDWDRLIRYFVGLTAVVTLRDYVGPRFIEAKDTVLNGTLRLDAEGTMYLDGPHGRTDLMGSIFNNYTNSRLFKIEFPANPYGDGIRDWIEHCDIVDESDYLDRLAGV